MAKTTARWQVTADLVRDGTIILPNKLTLGRCEIVDYEITVQTTAASREEAEREAEKQFRAATSALFVATGRPFGFDVKSCRNLESGAGGGRVWHGVDFIAARRLTDADIELAQELTGLLENIGTPPERLVLALDDLRRAIEERSPFAFVHLNRCIEQVREHLRCPGDDEKRAWKNVHEALNLSPEYLKFMSGRRTPVAHAPRKPGEEKAIAQDIHEGAGRASQTLVRFVKYLANKPVGEKL